MSRARDRPRARPRAAARSRAALTVVEGGAHTCFGRAARREPLRARSRCARPALLAGAAARRASAWREAYTDGLWDSPRPHRASIRVGARATSPALDDLRAALAAAARAAPARRVARCARNTPRAQPRATSPPTTTSATTCSRADARRDDDVLVRRLRARRTMTLERRRSRSSTASADGSTSVPATRLLEIGTGWGGFARPRRRRRYGCRVTTTTISREQHDASPIGAVREAGLEDRVTVLLDDYRDLEGTYDKLVVDRDDRGGRLERLRHVLPRVQRPARARRRDAAAGDRRSGRPRLPGREALDATSSARSSSPAAACRRCEVIAAASRARPTCTGPPRGHRPALRRDAAPLAGELRRARPTSWRRSATTSASAASGTSTCAYCEAGFDERRIGLVQTVLAKPHWGRRPRAGLERRGGGVTVPQRRGRRPRPARRLRRRAGGRARAARGALAGPSAATPPTQVPLRALGVREATCTAARSPRRWATAGPAVAGASICSATCPNRLDRTSGGSTARRGAGARPPSSRAPGGAQRGRRRRGGRLSVPPRAGRRARGRPPLVLLHPLGADRHVWAPGPGPAGGASAT